MAPKPEGIVIGASSESNRGMKSVGSRLALGLGLVVLVMVAMAAAAAVLVQGIARNNAQARARAAHLSEAARWRGLVHLNLDRALSATRLEAALAAGAPPASVGPTQARLAQDMAETARSSAELQKRLERDVDEADLGRRIADVAAARQRFVQLRQTIHDDLQMGEGAARIDAELVPAARAMLDALEALGEEISRQTGATYARVDAAARSAIVLLAVGACLGGALSALVAWWLVRGIRRPLAEAIALAERTAEGDLREDTVGESHDDELGHLVRQVVRMRTHLRGMLAAIRQASAVIRNAAAEIADGSQNLSSRADEQLGNLQRTTASIEQLAGTVKHSADAAQQASELANAANEAATRGGAVVAQVVNRMKEIGASADRIAEIIGVIDNIAFQTNILALNAAVEAARAGEQGRGFAVVAGEVRNLAQKSALAAREIKVLIGESVAQARSGAELVEQAGEAMERIVAGIKKVADLVGEISHATADQSSRIAQANHAVQAIERMTQQNAVLVEQSAAAAASLHEQAHELAAAVAIFRLERQDAHVPAAQARTDSRASRGGAAARPAAARTLALIREGREAAYASAAV